MPWHGSQGVQNTLVAYAPVANLASNHLLTRSFQFRGIALNDVALAVHDSLVIQKGQGCESL